MMSNRLENLRVAPSIVDFTLSLFLVVNRRQGELEITELHRVVALRLHESVGRRVRQGDDRHRDGDAGKAGAAVTSAVLDVGVQDVLV